MSTSKVFSFAQGDSNKGNGGIGVGKKIGGDDQTYDKNYCKYKECYKCGEKVPPASHCAKTKKYKDNAPHYLLQVDRK